MYGRAGNGGCCEDREGGSHKYCFHGAVLRFWKFRSMRLVIGFFLLCWSVAAHAQQPYFQPPTATELFNLRSRCAELGNKFLDDLVVFRPLTKSITSRYDPRTNHCYGDVVTQNPHSSYHITEPYSIFRQANHWHTQKRKRARKLGWYLVV